MSALQNRAGSSGLARGVFVQVGQWAHVFEYYINSKVVKENSIKWVNESSKEGVDPKKPRLVPRIRQRVKPLAEEIAFQKGVQYFTEIFFFYGLLMTMALYELKKNAKDNKINSEKLTQCSDSIKDHNIKLEELRKEIEKADSNLKANS